MMESPDCAWNLGLQLQQQSLHRDHISRNESSSFKVAVVFPKEKNAPSALTAHSFSILLQTSKDLNSATIQFGGFTLGNSSQDLGGFPPSAFPSAFERNPSAQAELPVTLGPSASEPFKPSYSHLPPTSLAQSQQQKAYNAFTSAGQPQNQVGSSPYHILVNNDSLGCLESERHEVNCHVITWRTDDSRLRRVDVNSHGWFDGMTSLPCYTMTASWLSKRWTCPSSMEAHDELRVKPFSLQRMIPSFMYLQSLGTGQRTASHAFNPEASSSSSSSHPLYSQGYQNYGAGGQSFNQYQPSSQQQAYQNYNSYQVSPHLKRSCCVTQVHSTVCAHWPALSHSFPGRVPLVYYERTVLCLLFDQHSHMQILAHWRPGPYCVLMLR